ncbi:ATP-binding protein [Desulfonatronum thioautotrophicum]|uniref:ATP-binding protein n=1 Tax=Desulfonatronum thioautotrophicum TaxID=617001 RepID=UPI0005EB25BE|nr:ATP-binding protein [Desulfonatronum thioautotrophicum]
MPSFFDHSETLGVLHGFNPWWTERPFPVPKFRRLAYKACRSYLDNTSLHRAILLSGPRRVGKTVLLQQLAAALLQEGRPARSIIYLSLDHPLLKLLSLRETLRMYHQDIHPEGEPAFLLLDEIQYSREWETEIKLLVDHHPRYRIVATGSASVVHREKLAESGVGRWVTVPVPTLSFYEFTCIRDEPVPVLDAQMRPSSLFGLKDTDFAEIALKMRPLQPLFNRYLLVGGFPETARQDDIALCQRLLREDVVERVLKRDMTALFGVRNINDLEKLFIYLCLHTSGILAHAVVAKELGTTPITVGNHLALLEQANLVYRLPPVQAGGKKALKARNKYYLVDAALRNAVLLRGEEILTNFDEMGLIVETTVLRHLFAYYYRDTPEIAYWRDTATGQEVDIIIRSPAYHFPFEVKFKEKAALENNSGLVRYCAAGNISQAYLVTKQDTHFNISTPPGSSTQFLKIPAHILCYLLGQAERLLWK